MKRKISAIGVLFIAFCFTAVARAEAPMEFFHGKTIKLVVGSGVGAGYDNFARATVRHLHVPGDPTIIVQNMPGAGGMIAANYLYNVAEKDGTVIGLINRYTVVQAIVGNKRARYEPKKFTWLGTPASYDEDPYVLIIRSDLPLKTVHDIRTAKEPLIVGNTGSDVARILEPALGMNVKIIEYKEKGGVDIALARGEVDAMGIAYANLKKRHPDWLKKKSVRPLVQFVRKRTAVLPDVVASSELVKTPEQRALLNFVEVPLSMAYPFVLPPGLPADRVAVFKKAFDAVLRDPAYKKEVLKLGLAYSPQSGEEVTKLVAELADTPASAIKRYRNTVGIRGGK